ncbi:MAG TPA: thermonuclease family protein [Thermoanaerobaculia bacterium]|nr:thermonuclease family protein [Thermoanaerobaculia bacterium]
MTRLIFLAALLMFSIHCGDGSLGAETTSAPSGTRCAKGRDGAHVVVRVSDGDTIVIRREGQKPSTVRLVGVDAPEVDGPYKRSEPGGDRSKAFVQSLLAGQSVYVEFDPAQGTTDKHGRQLAYVYRARDCLLVNGEIIRQGYGESYRRFRYRDKELFARYEREARSDRRGLWKEKERRR